MQGGDRVAAALFPVLRKIYIKVWNVRDATNRKLVEQVIRRMGPVDSKIKASKNSLVRIGKDFESIKKLEDGISSSFGFELSDNIVDGI